MCQGSKEKNKKKMQVSIADNSSTGDEIQENKSIYSLSRARALPAHPLIKTKKAALPELWLGIVKKFVSCLG